MTPGEDLTRLAGAWRAACTARPVDVATRDGALRDARRLLQDPARRDFGWFARAFRDPETWSFAVAVVHGVLPRKLLAPILDAAIDHPNVSSNQWFIRAAIKAFGAAEVSAYLNARLAERSDYEERKKVRSAQYWVGFAADETARARLQRRARKLSGEEKLRAFMQGDVELNRVLVWLLPFDQPGTAALCAEAIAWAKSAGDPYVLAVLRDKHLVD